VVRSPLSSRAVLDAWYARVGRAYPFLKWAGGKQVFLQRHSRMIPTAFSGSYIEPFLGSGALFFFIMRHQTRPCLARLGDTNRALIRCFIAVRDEPETVHEQLKVVQAGYSAARDKARFYYEVRETQNARMPDMDPAAFIFLNRTCWNGLFRVNKQGKFNVPFGAPKTGTVIPSLDELLSSSAALAQAHIRATSWENTLVFAEPGDFVFLDPPYYSDLLTDRSVTKYQKKQFSLREHERLARSLSDLNLRGVHFLLTNSGESEMIDLYTSYGLHVQVVEVPRPINSKIDRRVPVQEIVVTASEADS
jgi:DNA adenine methylase